MLLAQLTDTHVLNPASDEERWVDNNGRLAEAVKSLNAENPRPDAILATGDLTNNGAPGELEELLRLLSPLEIPIMALPGNHDDRAQIRSAFPMDWASEDNLSWVVELGSLTIIGLDTSVPGVHHGELDEERQRWLADALAATSDRPTAIAMHHPPFATGIGWMDDTMLRRAEVFEEMVRANPHVNRIFCGHVHRPIHATINGVAASVGLSTVHHVALDTSPSAPRMIIRDPAGYQLHRFDGSGWLSHTRYIDTGEQAFTPSWALES